MKLTLALLARYAEVDPESGLLNLTGAVAGDIPFQVFQIDDD